ncbi:MAG TPA: DUF4097 family beta strand repeat-containing protein [Anaerolineales bacterium]|nr:DUF4097 family beta strand repeat-containing protein [Anaerolineales bacterium]
MKYKWLIVGALMLALLVLCVAMVGILWATAGFAQTEGLRLRMFSADTVSAEADEEQRFTVSGPAELAVTNVVGDVTVTGGGGDEIVVKAHKTAWGATQSEANAALAGLQISMTQAGDKVIVTVQQPEEVTVVGTSRSDSVDFTIAVPAETAVTARADFGDVALSGTTGKVDLQTKSGKIGVEAVSGEIILESDFGNVTLEDAQAVEVGVASKSGAITLRRVEAEGTISLSSDFGSVTFTTGRAASLTLEAKSGEVKLADLTVKGAVKVHSDFGQLTLEQVAGEAYDLTTNSGAVTVDGARGPVIIHSDFGNVELRGGEDVALDLRTKSGGITFSGTLGEGPHRVETDFGSIWLALPESAALTLDLKTDFGKVKSDLPVTLSGEFSDEHWQGTTNGGGDSLTVRTKNGNITLVTLNP